MASIGGRVTKQEELKACPFCGEKEEIRIAKAGDLFFGQCQKCHGSSGPRLNRVGAANDWNRRPSHD